MDGLMIVYNPWLQLAVKMALVLLLLIQLKRCQFSAATHAWIWRIGMMVLLFLPWLNQHLLFLQLPILPAVGQSHEQVLPHLVEPAVWQNNFAASQPTEPVMPVWAWLVLLVSLALVARIIHQIIKLYQITAAAEKINRLEWHQIAERCANQLNLAQSPSIKVTPTFRSPCTWGLFKPVVLIPENIRNDEAFRVILMHELAHIKRKDWFWMMFAHTFTALFWFNPMLWWVKKQLINSFEQACDELVLRQQVPPSRYVETLLSFHPACQQPLTQVTTLMAQPSAMYQRLNLILNPQQRSPIMNSNKQSLLLISASLTTLLITASQLTSAHEATVIEHSDPVSEVTVPTAPRPASPEMPHLQVPAVPSLHSVAQPPQPEIVPTPAIDPHIDGVVAPHPVQAPAAVPHAGHRHEAAEIEDLHEAKEREEAEEIERMREAKMEAVEMALREQEQAMAKHQDTEVDLQEMQRELDHMTEKLNQEKAEIKQQLAQLDQQRRQLQVQQQKQEAQMHALLEKERAQLRDDVQAMKREQARLEQESIRVKTLKLLKVQ